MTTPSRLQVVSLASAPFEKTFDCCPLSLPATLTRSTMTPGTVRIRAQGSREVGICSSSSFEMVVEVPVRGVTTRRVARDRPVSSTDATLRTVSSAFGRSRP
jgi:hypothetical protein